MTGFMTMTFAGKITLNNGKTVSVYSKKTKTGKTQYYQKSPGNRAIRISKAKAEKAA